ncbi:MAG: DNA-binding protein [Alloprevotella sp.]|nr:DNA-binding protein [Alloprevotella sp.]
MDTFNYKVIARKSPKDKSVKYYASPVKAGTVTTDDLAREIAGRCSLTYGDLVNVFRNLNDIMPKYLSMGFHVKLDGLGTLFLTMNSKGTPTKKEFRAENIKKIGFHIYLANMLKNSVLEELKLEKVKDEDEEDEP